MKELKLVISLFILLCTVFGASAEYESSERKYEYHTIYNKTQSISRNIDRYIDVLVLAIREGHDNIDPYPLPDVLEEFNERVWITSLSGQFRMQNGIIHNLKTLARKGNASLNYNELKLYIDTEFIFELVIFDYSFIGEIAGRGPQGFLTGHARDLVFHAVLVYDFSTDKIKLGSLDLIQQGEVKVNVTISHWVDWFANPIINWLSRLYEEKLLYMLRFVLKKIIGEHLPPEKILFMTYPPSADQTVN